MSREFRRVPPDWAHPTVETVEQAVALDVAYHESPGRHKIGDHVPQYATTFAEALDEWLAKVRDWELGPEEVRATAARVLGKRRAYFWEWDEMPPDPATHRVRTWEREEATSWQYYETTTEGTPLSPVCATAEEMAAWMIENDGYFKEHPDRALGYVLQDAW